MRKIVYDKTPLELEFRQENRKTILYQKVKTFHYDGTYLVKESDAWIPVPKVDDDRW
jgi:hypothetical protein